MDIMDTNLPIQLKCDSKFHPQSFQKPIRENGLGVYLEEVYTTKTELPLSKLGTA